MSMKKIKKWLANDNRIVLKLIVAYTEIDFLYWELYFTLLYYPATHNMGTKSESCSTANYNSNRMFKRPTKGQK